MAKASAAHGSGKTGSPSAEIGSCGDCASGDEVSHRLKVALPCIDRNAERGIGALAPYLAAIEDDGIDPLRILALAMCIVVGKDERALHRLHDPGFGTRIAGQSRVAGWIEVLRPNSVADCKAR